MKTQLIAFIVASIFMILDVITGFANAVKQHNVQSSKMREGLWHKASFLLIMGVAFGLEFAQNFLDLGFSVPLLVPIAVYIILNELVSVLENLNKIADGELTGIIKKFFPKKKDDEGKNDDDNDDNDKE